MPWLDPNYHVDNTAWWCLAAEERRFEFAHTVLTVEPDADLRPRVGDMLFIAHAWEDVRRLLATVRAQQEEIARLRKFTLTVEGDPDSFISNEGQAQDGVTTAIRARAYFLRHDLAALDEALVHWTLSDVAGAELIVRLDRAGVAVRRMTDQLTLPKLRQRRRRDKSGART
jgi:hypothetical protein